MVIGFAVIPNPALVNALIAFQRAAQEVLQLEPTLHVDPNLPHLTIVQGLFDDNVPFYAALENAAAYLKGFETLPKLQLESISYRDIGWYFLTVERTDWLVELQRLVMVRVEHFMHGGNLHPLHWQTYPEAELASYRRYGYRYVGPAYLPHITLGHGAPPREDTVAALNALWNQLQLPAQQPIDRLTVYQMGEFGAHASTIATFSVGESVQCPKCGKPCTHCAGCGKATCPDCDFIEYHWGGCPVAREEN